MNHGTKTRSLVFAAPQTIEISEDAAAAPAAEEVFVETEASAISAGTELLIFRGEVEADTVLDETIGSLSSGFHYPLRYGYACVGRVRGVGPGAEKALVGRRVFVFHPHASHLSVPQDQIVLLPEELPTELACLLPTVETAVNLVLDARISIGERVVVVGQGIVGLALTAVLARYPLDALWSVEPDAWRRGMSERLGANRSLAPATISSDGVPNEVFAGAFGEQRADLCFELSSQGDGLDLALQLCGREGRVVVGSWYGDKELRIRLGTHFHRNRIQVQSSQVSHMGSHLQSRWTHRRRLAFAMKLLPELGLEPLVTHRFPIENAAEAYRLLAGDDREAGIGQIILTYG